MGQILSTTLQTLKYFTSPAKEIANNNILFKKISEKAISPTRGSPDSAGYDLYSAYDTTIPAYGKALVKTDIAIALPENCYGRVAPRSGLAWKHHLDVGAGVIDRDYRGNVGVVLFNHSSEDYNVHQGDRVAQLVIERIAMLDLKEVEDLEDTSRGEGGYGSTGKDKTAKLCQKTCIHIIIVLLDKMI